MEPTSEATKLEGPGHFLEYTGVGKLRGKKVLITGGEYVLTVDLRYLLSIHFSKLSFLFGLLCHSLPSNDL